MKGSLFLTILLEFMKIELGKCTYFVKGKKRKSGKWSKLLRWLWMPWFSMDMNHWNTFAAAVQIRPLAVIHVSIFPPPPRAFLFSSSLVFERSPRIIRNMGCGHSEPTTIEPIDKLDNDYEVRPATWICMTKVILLCILNVCCVSGRNLPWSIWRQKVWVEVKLKLRNIIS
mgnify:CR=1 FL=1